MTVIDCQCHWYPPAFCEAQLSRTTYPLWQRDDDGYVFQPSPTQSWRMGPTFVDLDHQFELMAAAGIDVLLSSPVIAGDVTALPIGEAREACQLLNEELSAAQRARRGRFYGLAVLPLQDVGVALELLDDAIGRLGLKGVLLHSNIAGGSVADREIWPLYERLEETGTPVFLHPTQAFGEKRLTDYALEPPLAYMFDTTVAALSLIVGGVLDAFPALKIVHPHYGGTLPYLIDRAEVYRRQGRWDLPRPLREYLPRFYTDTVNDSPAALALGQELYGIDRLLFSTDHPYFAPADEIAFVREHLDPAHARQVFAGNAIRLLGLDEAELAASSTSKTE